jgi:IMP dehydrogenase
MHKLIKEGLAFDDVVLLPTKSSSSDNIDITSRLTSNISLKAPIISSAMDTVTEAKMAIAMARQGGIGIVHSNMTIEAQVTEVDKVKRSEHGVITDPFFLSPNHYIYEAAGLMKKYHISGVPITENEKLVGIVTNRDLRFEIDHNKKIYEIMSRENLVTAREGITLDESKEILKKYKVEKLPIVDKDFNLKGLITIKDIEKTIKYPNAAKDEGGRLLVGASVILGSDMMDRISALLSRKVDVIVLETGHANADKITAAIELIKGAFKDIELIVGNIATAELTELFVKAGADAIKVGVGVGSLCTTADVSGVYAPQITAICECSLAAKPYNVPVIADGGIRCPGDLVKAIVAGADSCMIGSLFAGCQESPGDIELLESRKYKVYKSMNYTAHSDQNTKNFVSEGLEGRVYFKGKLEDTARQLTGGLKLGMNYCGCSSINDLKENARFIKVSGYAARENQAQNVLITREAINHGSYI